jgi:hypothetical protein
MDSCRNPLRLPSQSPVPVSTDPSAGRKKGQYYVIRRCRRSDENRQGHADVGHVHGRDHGRAPPVRPPAPVTSGPASRPTAPAASPLTRQYSRAMPAHPVCRRVPRRPETLRPLHHAGNAHPEQRCRRPARTTAGHRRHYPIPKICRIGSCHRRWPPTPASILNQKSSSWGIPYLRCRPTESCSNRHFCRTAGSIAQT